MKIRSAHHLFETVFFPAVVLREFAHAAVYRHYDVAYDVRLSPFEDDADRSSVRTDDVPPARAQVLT